MADIKKISISGTQYDIKDANALHTDRISNCITEIPQDIKLELNNGTLTVKAGTIFYTANGSQYSLASDVTVGVGGANDPYFIFLQTGGTVSYAQVSVCYSGSTAPTGIEQNALWLDTTNQVIKRTSDSGSTWSTTTYGLPIAICTPSSGSWTSIDQVFNGAGYIGHHAFVLPGVKALIPDGFNADGTLKSVLRTVTSLSINEILSTFNSVVCDGTASMAGYLTDINDLSEAENSSWKMWYVKDMNKLGAYYNDVFSQRYRTKLVDLSYNGTSVTKFDVRQPVRLATKEMTDNLQTQVDGKLDKVTSTDNWSRAYVVGNNGTQAMTPLVTTGTTAYSIATRTSAGTVRTATPTDNNDATNKSYVDTALSSKANTSLNNLDSTGQLIIDSQNGTISNCILDIPQDIKLELNNGTLTLKSGSVLTAPDGTQKTTTADQTTTFSTDGQYVLFVASNNGSFQLNNKCLVSKVGSGSSLPSDDTNYNYFLNTSDSKIYRWTSGAWVEWGVALPVGIITVSNGAISSIDQVFNGAGYIGSTVFVLPGVKYLIPVGFNSDGTLKSNIINNQELRINTFTSETGKRYWLLRNSEVQDITTDYVEAEYNDGTHSRGYYYKDNYVESATGTRYKDRLFFSTITLSNGVITSLDVRQPVRLATTEMLDTIQATVNTKANDSEVVKLAGTQTITGNKTFSGSVALGSSATATTQTTGDNSTKVATTAYVKNAIDNVAINAHNLFDFKWTDYELTDQSWLRANSYSWQDGTVYTNAYNHLVDDIDGKTATSETVGSYTISYYLSDDGHKITTDETTVANIYNESGVAWYYVLDTTNQRFKLPRTKWGFVGLRDNVGKYVEAGLPNITGRVGPSSGNVQDNSSGAFYLESGDMPSGQYYVNSNKPIYAMDASRSSPVYGRSTTVQPPATQMYLYFYVGQFSQSATEQTAGLNAELFNGKADKDLSNLTSQAGAGLNSVGVRTVVETYVNGTEWYRIWSDGWIEQGGRVNVAAADTSFQFLKPFSNANYTILASSDGNTNVLNINYNNDSTYDHAHFDMEGYGTGNCRWYACGY